MQRATGNSASLSNNRPIFILNNVSSLFEFAIHDHVTQYLEFKPNSYLYSFTTSKSTIINLVTKLGFITSSLDSQPHADAIYFDCDSAFELIPHTLQRHEFGAFGLVDSKVF
jgi:hypothetical protein